jgi:hypothetical protein
VVALCAGLVLLAPFALAFGSVSEEAWELAYFGLLATAYSRAELSVVYPLSRGAAPVLVLVVSASLLGAGVSAAQAAGVVGVGLGVLGRAGGWISCSAWRSPSRSRATRWWTTRV